LTSISLKCKFSGALSAAIITLPMAVAYVVTAFDSLGPTFRHQAAVYRIERGDINLFDRSTFRFFRFLFKTVTARKEVAFSLLVNLSVAAITVSVNLNSTKFYLTSRNKICI
jgi:hypothetical protein